MLIVGLVFVPLGSVILATSIGTPEYVLDYTDCLAKAPTASFASPPGKTTFEWRKTGSDECTLKFSITKPIEGPVFMYYRLTNYYQNNRMYVRSVDWQQLAGSAVSRDSLGACSPLVGPESDQRIVYYPCGLIANSMFSDTIGPLRHASNLFTFSEHGIAWQTDLEKYGKTQYKADQVRPPPYWVSNADLVDPQTGLYRSLPDLSTNERFIVWMRTAAFPNFRKLYGRYPGTISDGEYTVAIKSIFDVQSFGGTKSLVITNASWLGGRNVFLGLAYVITGGLFLCFGLGFLVQHVVRPRRLGDTSYLSWSKRASKPNVGGASPPEHSPSAIDADEIIEEVSENQKESSSSDIQRV